MKVRKAPVRCTPSFDTLTTPLPILGYSIRVLGRPDALELAFLGAFSGSRSLECSKDHDLATYRVCHS